MQSTPNPECLLCHRHSHRRDPVAEQAAVRRDAEGYAVWPQFQFRDEVLDDEVLDV